MSELLSKVRGLPFDIPLIPKHNTPDEGIRWGEMSTEGGVMVAQEATFVRAEVPVRLLTEIEVLVKAGWFRSLDELMMDTLRRFVESHQAERMEQSIREDVDGGCTVRSSFEVV